MMSTTLSAKLAGMKAKVLAGTAIAAAALMMAAPAAQAQRAFFGIRIGTPAPVYVDPAPPVAFAGPGYYDGSYFPDYDAWRAHYFARDRDFDRDYYRDFDRDRHFDRDHYRDFDRR